MLALGIESTAHTFGVGIADEDATVLANERRMYRPEEGGIHPRAAAEHHTANAADALRSALDAAGVTMDEVDLVAFSQGPGLGPCLRTGATAARVLALKHGVPLVGVNHCVAHLEIGRAATGLDDPLLLYASGGNTQVISFTGGRYRVHGETLDIGVGNFLDKFAREMGMPFPGGPEIERIARDGERLIDLPYSVKGMDVAFSGILTAALARIEDTSPEDLCFSVQETAFAMLTEVTERALAHVGHDSVVLGGGVACNQRLTDMVDEMCSARGAEARAPPRPLLVDNGAMIAYTGILQANAGLVCGLHDSGVDQRFRTDDVDVAWRRAGREPTPDPWRGAEATAVPGTLDGRSVVAKTREPKTYRHPALDHRLRAERARAEARLLREARHAGVATPTVLDVDGPNARITMTRVNGPRLRDVLDTMDPADARGLMLDVGRAAARLHAAHVVHGDLTTSNVMLDAPWPGNGERPGLVVIDLGLSFRDEAPEPKAVDLQVLHETLTATHAGVDGAFDAVLDGYRQEGAAEVLHQFETVVNRGRYK